MFRRFCRFFLVAAALVAAPLAQAQLVIPGGGGGASVGGSSGQLQFNNAGAFGGGAGTAWDDTNRTLTIANAGATQSLLATYSELKFNRAGTAYLYNANAGGSLKVGVGSGADGITVNSDKSVTFFSALSGSGATVTTSTPLLDLSQTWNAGAVAFSALKLSVTDTASASGSLLLDLQVGGVSRFKVDKGGAVTAGNTLYATDLLANTNGGVIAIGSVGDVKMYRDAANTLALRNGASAQSFNVYNTYTDSSNYERGGLYWSGGAFTLGTQSAGTGGARAVQLISSSSVYVQTNGGSGPYWVFDTGGNLKAGVDGSYDIGVSGANRARNAYLAGKIVTGSTTLHETSVALTNGAAAATGTLTNAPAAGNPTKWFPINDNGTTRYVPAW